MLKILQTKGAKNYSKSTQAIHSSKKNFAPSFVIRNFHSCDLSRKSAVSKFLVKHGVCHEVRLEFD